MTKAEQKSMTVLRHVAELRQLAADGTINELDHNVVGGIMCVHIGHLIGISDRAWEEFKRIVAESRAVEYSEAPTDENKEATADTDARAAV